MNVLFGSGVQDARYRQGLYELRKDLHIGESGPALRLTAKEGARIGFERDETGITVYYDRPAAFFRQLRRALSAGGNAASFEERVFDTLSLLVDNSRNAVMNVPAVKELIRKLALLGYSELQLYTEDTYEVEGEPYFGYLRGRYSRAELREIDAYAKLFGIELVPCIQTLAHLRSLYRWSTYYKGAFDCNDVLLVGSERVRELIEHIFATLSETFTSRKVNIGMDEAFMLGRGKYRDLYGQNDPAELYRRHLAFVLSVAKKYGFSVQMWGDMFWREYEEAGRSGKKMPAVPEGVTLIGWSYGNPFADYETQVREGEIAHRFAEGKNFCSSFRFCGGAAKWYGFAPNNAFSLPVNRANLNDCERAGVCDVMLSAWGDCGSETPVFSVLPNIVYYAERAYGNRSEERFRAAFSEMFCPFRLFMSIDGANDLSGKGERGYINTSAKYLLYNDTFLGCMDKTLQGGIAEAYRAQLAKLKKAKRAAGEYSYLFDTQIALVKALSKKFDLGVRTRKAYRSGDKAELLRLAKEDYPAAMRAIRAFFEAFQKQWMRVNKPHGIDVTHIRIGALLFRLQQNAKRLKAYAEGKTERIEELEEDILDEFGQGNRIIMQNWGETVTANTLTEYMSYV